MGCVQSDVRDAHTNLTLNTNTNANTTTNTATKCQQLTISESQKQKVEDKTQTTITCSSNNKISCNEDNMESAAAKITPLTVMQRPEVPLTSWYAAPFTQSINTPITEFHFKNKGHVVFATRHIPVAASELEKLPHHSPSTCNNFTLGKDFIYGMAYLYNTPLFIEHYWRSRVAHLNRFRQGKIMLPNSLRRRRSHRQGSTTAELSNHHKCKSKDNEDLLHERECKNVEITSSNAYDEQNDDKRKKSINAVNSSHLSTCESSSTPSSSSSELVNTNIKLMQQHSTTNEYATRNNKCNNEQTETVCATNSKMDEIETEVVTTMERSEASLLQQPFVDLLIGFKVYINDELVPDHYPSLRSLPQCTATLDINDATNYWVCVPFVLIGYLNHFMLDPIAIYRTLSLNFVEFLLRLKTPQNEHEVVDYSLRVEIVYGCRAEAFFCTDFIARGSCTLHLTRHCKAALKAYEEKLRLLIKSKKSSEQVIRRSDLIAHKDRIRSCVFCGSPLRYVCTVCGAEVCGKVSCARQQLVGYPRGCSAHKIPVE